MPRPDAVADECALIADPGVPVVTVALPDRIDATNAPHPSNESEQLLFRQLYETLVRLDCKGRVAPGLAASWRLRDDGRSWIVTLREDARFSDGTVVTAADVRTSWTQSGVGGELQHRVSRLVKSVEIVDDQNIAITLRTERTVPAALAHSDLAVAKSVADSTWPLGTRPTRTSLDREAPPASAISVITLSRDNLPAMRFLVASGDTRDLLDEGVDLLLTRDPAALDYATTLPQFRSVPLSWQQFHVLLTPGRPRSSPSLSDAARQALAGDAVRGEARGAGGPFWWETLTDCEIAPASPRNRTSLAPRIVYDASDNVARDLGERFVGLSRSSDPVTTSLLDVLLPDRRRPYQRAAGLTSDAMALAQRLGNDAGYIVSLDKRPLEPCRDAHALMDAAPWLDPGTIVPLVETRLHAIVRRGRDGMSMEWDGALSIAGSDPIRK